MTGGEYIKLRRGWPKVPESGKKGDVPPVDVSRRKSAGIPGEEDGFPDVREVQHLHE